MKKIFVYSIIAIATAASVLYRKVIFETMSNLSNIKIKSIKKKAPKQRKKTISAKQSAQKSTQKSTVAEKNATKQSKPMAIKLVKKSPQKAQRRKSKNVVNIK